MKQNDLAYFHDPTTGNLWKITIRVGDLVKYRKLDEENENESAWVRIQYLTGIVLPRNEEIQEPHILILWNTGEIHTHFIPPYDPQVHFKVIS